MKKVITILLSVLLIAGLFTGCNGEAVEDLFRGSTPTPTPTPAETVTVTFDPNGGTGTMEPQIFTKGVSAALNECSFTAPDGKAFGGWMLSADGTVVDYADKASYPATESKTLYACWIDSGAAEFKQKYENKWFVVSQGSINVSKSALAKSLDGSNKVFMNPDFGDPPNNVDSYKGAYVYLYSNGNPEYLLMKLYVNKNGEPFMGYDGTETPSYGAYFVYNHQLYGGFILGADESTVASVAAHYLTIEKASQRPAANGSFYDSSVPGAHMGLYGLLSMEDGAITVREYDDENHSLDCDVIFKIFNEMPTLATTP